MSKTLTQSPPERNPRSEREQKEQASVEAALNTMTTKADRFQATVRRTRLDERMRVRFQYD
jgi:hypothetical protein